MNDIKRFLNDRNINECKQRNNTLNNKDRELNNL